MRYMLLIHSDEKIWGSMSPDQAAAAMAAYIAYGDALRAAGKYKNGTNAKAVRVLGWSPRSREDACVASAESLIALGLLKDSAEQAA